MEKKKWFEGYFIKKWVKVWDDFFFLFCTGLLPFHFYIPHVRFQHQSTDTVAKAENVPFSHRTSDMIAIQCTSSVCNN